jgi:hypothetical protein
MATYIEITDHIRRADGFVAASCWIADVLSDYGLTRGEAHNRIDPDRRVKPCPPSKRNAIVRALEHFGMI